LFHPYCLSAGEPQFDGSLFLPILILTRLRRKNDCSARGDTRNLGAEHLLPEERALIAPLLYD